MLVVLPHQNDELDIINIQKSLISSLNEKNILEKGCIYTEDIPLWFFLPNVLEKYEEEKLLKSFSKTITSFYITDIKGEDNYIKLIANIKISDIEYISYMPLLKLYKTKDMKKSETINDKERFYKEIKNAKESFLPLKLKSIRVASGRPTSKNSWSIKTFCWTKLKG